MPNELVAKKLTGGELSKYDFESVVAGVNTFLERLQLFGSKSDACTEQKIGIGHYGIVTDGGITDVGEEVEVVVVSWRPKSLQIDGGNIITEYDPESEIYKKIAEMSGTPNSGCMYGPEYLLWVPCQNKFVTFFMSSKTARREAKRMHHLVGCAATFKAKLIDNGRYKWHGPVVIECSTPLDVPDEETIRTVVESFQNPPKSEVELAPDDTGRAR